MTNTMPSCRFLQVPVTIREQIYEELLTYKAAAPENEASAGAAPICGLLLLNRFIHDEVLSFFRSKLCVLIKTNAIVSQRLLDEGDLPIISKLSSNHGATHQDASKFPVAMELDLYLFQHGLSTESFATFIIPASSMQAFIETLHLRNQHPSITYTLHQTFSHTHEKAVDLLIQPWIKEYRHANFVSVSAGSTIPNHINGRLQSQLLQQYAVGALGRIAVHFDHLQRPPAVPGPAQDKAAHAFAIASRQMRLMWECQRIESRKHMFDKYDSDDMASLWLRMSRIGSNHALVLLIAAHSGQHNSEVKPPGSKDAFRLAEMRQVAEDMIHFLREHTPNVRANDQELTSILNERKALLSLRAHQACKGLGDLAAAEAYLDEATKCRPCISPGLWTILASMKERGAGLTGIPESKVVKW